MAEKRDRLGFTVLVTAVLAAQTAILWQDHEGDQAVEEDRAALRAEVRDLGQALLQSRQRLGRIEELLEDTNTRLAELQVGVQAQQDRQAALAAEVERTAREAAEVASSDPSAAASGGPSGAERGGIPEVLERLEKMEKKLARPQGGEQWKPSLEEMSKELELQSDQESQVAQAANTAKDQLMALARIRRADGGSFLDELADAVHESQSNPAAMQTKMGPIFLRLAVEKVPGRDTTYLTEILSISGEAHQRFRSAMSEEQYADLSRRNVDVFSIKTGYDPFGEYVASRWGSGK